VTAPRVLVVGPRLDVGGTERHLAQLIPALARRGLDMHLHVMVRGGVLEADIAAAGVPIDGAEAGMSRLANVRATVAGLVRRIRLLRPDLVHLFLPEPTILGTLACELAGHRRRVVSRRSLAHYRPAYPGLGAIERAIHLRTLALLGNSAAVAAELVTECGDPAKVGIIRNGVVVPPSADASTRAARRATLGVGQETFAIVVVANLIAYKGHADLLAALARAADCLPGNWRVVFLGRDDGQGGVLDETAESLGIRERLIRLGERPDAADLAGACDVAVLPSHQEGFSNALVEGMARGLPTIGTAVGGNLDAIEDGRTGLLVPVAAADRMAAALCRLASDRPLAARLGAAARVDVATRFGFENMVERYERLYRGHARLGQVPVSAILEGGGCVTPDLDDV
jgi:glycosyltransferase involved in cell wall biosynthesis